MLLNFVFIMFIVGTSTAQPQPTDLAVSALIGPCRGNELGLLMQVRNNSTAEILVPEAQLPWGDDSSLLLVAIDRDRKQIAEAIAVDDPVATMVRIPVGGTVPGCVQLPRRFRGLNATLERGDVHLFWSYELRTRSRSYDRVYGGVLLRQRR